MNWNEERIKWIMMIALFVVCVLIITGCSHTEPQIQYQAPPNITIDPPVYPCIDGEVPTDAATIEICTRQVLAVVDALNSL